MKIYAPVKDTNGRYASIYFRNGVGETNNAYLIEWFKTHGYKVESDIKFQPINTDNILDVVGEVEPDFDNMTPNELREWAKANGLASKIKNTRNKEKLLEIVRG